MTLLALDIGNSSTKIGVFSDGRLVGNDATSSECFFRQSWYESLDALLRSVKLSFADIADCAIASVVPSRTEEWRRFVAQLVGREPLIITSEMLVPSFLRTCYDPVESIGTDRLVNAVAADHFYSSPVICVSVGTATVVDAVSAAREFLGGAIMPGVGLLLESLADRTAQLPRVTPEAVRDPIGDTTAGCLRSGAVVGTAAAISGLARSFAKHLDLSTASTRVITGGYAPLVVPHLTGRWRHRPTLTLDGIELAWRHVRRPKSG